MQYMFYDQSTIADLALNVIIRFVGSERKRKCSVIFRIYFICWAVAWTLLGTVDLEVWVDNIMTRAVPDLR